MTFNIGFNKIESCCLFAVFDYTAQKTDSLEPGR